MMSGLCFLNKGRKVTTEIASASQVVECTLKNTKRVIGCDDDDSGTSNKHTQTCIAFGSVNECVENKIQQFEEDIIEVHGSTPCHLETVNVVDELDKKLEEKNFHPSTIRNLFAKVFSYEDNSFHYGFKKEMIHKLSHVLCNF